MHGPLNVTITV